MKKVDPPVDDVESRLFETGASGLDIDRRAQSRFFLRNLFCPRALFYVFALLTVGWLLGIAATCALIILLCGIQMAGLADRIADRTGRGEAVIGGVLLGAATSFSGAIVSFTSARDGLPDLAFSNGVGGIAAQTAFLALADLLYRKANLEHAAAELANLFQCGLLLLLLSIPLVAFVSPETTLLGVHPASFVLVIVYFVGVKATARLHQDPMWEPVQTRQTRVDNPDKGDEPGRPVKKMVGYFLLLMVITGLCGWVIAKLAGVVITRFDLQASVVGALMTAVITSLPELVTTLAAVRRGALQLAVGGIIGGNTFDTLFLTVSDIGYRDGSLYHAIGSQDVFWMAVASVMTAVLLLGLLYRERHGPGRIGLESLLLLLIYGGAIMSQTW